MSPQATVVEEILPYADDALRTVAGPANRHLALLESAFDVKIETPGGGFRVRGDQAGRTAARTVLDRLAERVRTGAGVDEADVRAAVSDIRRGGAGARPGAVPVNRRGGVVQAKTDAQGRYLATLAEKSLVFGVGPAGTGKTFLAVAYGASLLSSGQVSRLIITRPAVEAGERLGFLPGDLTEKVDPYMQPIWDALRDLMGAAEVERMRGDPAEKQAGRRDRRSVEVAPIAFMRGRTLNDAFVIVDEAQNCTRAQMKMVLTRLGDGARMAVTGDPSQVDLPNGADSGLAHAVRLLEGVEDVGVCRFTASDVVRHPLVERIVQAYDKDAAENPVAFGGPRR